MPDREFQVQTLQTADQWKSGLPVGLNVDAEGLSLFATPTFDRWLDRTYAGGDIVTDECGQTWWAAVDPRTARWALFRNDPRTHETEPVLQLELRDPIEPRKLWLTRDYLLIYDARHARVLGLSRENYQILFEVAAGKGELIDIDFDRVSAFYALIQHQGQIRLYRLGMPPDGATERQPVALPDMKEPVALAVSPDGVVYVLDVGLGRLLRLRPGEEKPVALAAHSERLLKAFKCSVFEVDARHVLFLAGSSTSAPKGPVRPPTPDSPTGKATASPELYQFTDDGSLIGRTLLPAGVTAITGLGFDAQQGVYVATNLGLARYTLTSTPVGQSGVYYSRALDNGQPEGLWHRLELAGCLPLKTSVEVFYYTSRDEALHAACDHVFDSQSSVEEKQSELEKLLKTLWQPSQPSQSSQSYNVFRSTASSEQLNAQLTSDQHDLLFLHNRGRYLYLKLVFTTFDEKNRPSVRRARIFYPRQSYLRYLPPIYSEDAVAAAFVERFLSLFETIFHGLEEEVTNLFQYFDPQLAPPEFLPWLASWIDLGVDEGLPVDRIRRLIREAPDLFGRKGTPSALARFLEIYTGASVLVIEHAHRVRPLLLGGELPLGLGTVVSSAGKAVFRLGDSSYVGEAVLRSQFPTPEEAFLPVARRFSIWLDLDQNEFSKRQATLRRIVEEQKPAHCACWLGALSSQNRVGLAQLGINTTVTAPQPYRVGGSTLGEATVIAKGRPAPRLERTARLGGPEPL